MLLSALILVGLFVVLMLVGVPIGVAMGLTGFMVIGLEGMGVMALPTNIWTGIAKYPLLALPMFVLAGLVFERAGVAAKMVSFAQIIVGNRTGALAIVVVLLCMILGGVSGSGAADAAAVAAVMVPPMLKEGYPRPYIASLTAAGGSTAVLIPPSIPFIVYSVLVPGVSVPALFLAGIVPGILSGLVLLVPAVWLAHRGRFGLPVPRETRPPRSLALLWRSFLDAIWGLAAPVVILGGLRSGAFTPTEAAVVAVFYGLFVGAVIYRSLSWRDLYEVLRDGAEISAVVLLIIALATIYAHAGSTVGIFDVLAQVLTGLTSNETLMLLAITVLLMIAGTALDAISTYLIFLPILLPIAVLFQWDLTWFGVIVTMNVAIGAFTPPTAVNLMVTCRIAGCTMESTLASTGWFLLAMTVVMLLVTFIPEIALALPRWLGDL
jgi:tripartite ATP-independent transporter DctM subunit